ncbi:MAG: BatA domain-containing protein [Flavobacteriaceae bacterium]
MQFKYPELLWALFLLLIPIIIHLFQLRKFKKTAFTNVSLLKRVQAQTRKSRSLKKWLLLITRILLFASIILAFAQPFLASETALAEKETVIYIDDSFSMQARTESSDLLELAVQDLIKKLPPDKEVSLFTNVQTFLRVTPAEFQNELLSLTHTHKQLSMSEVILKARSLFQGDTDGGKEFVVISDFQELMFNLNDSISGIDVHLVQLQPEHTSNIALDSVYISNSSPTQLELKATLKASGEVENSPVSIWNADTLIAKTAAKFNDSGRAEVDFSLPKDLVIDGRIEIADAGLGYDNQIYFNISKKKKIRVLVIGSKPKDFLERIYLEAESVLATYDLANLNYSDIDQQNLIILNQLNTIPASLQDVLYSYTSGGGSLVVIPSLEADLQSYNSLLSRYSRSRYTQLVESEQQITTISFDHPLYKNVFEKSVRNFQYPKVSAHFKMNSSAPAVLRLQNGNPFLVGDSGIYIFSAPIDQENTNFQNSPIIVPSFYNMGALSLNLPALYHSLNSTTKIDIPVSLPSDKIAKVVKNEYEFIPLQQSFSNKTTLDFEEHPSEDGIFDIVLGDSLVRRISFNYPRIESDLTYADLSSVSVSSKNTDVTSLLNNMEKDNKVNELWQWFVILALLFVLTEVLVQKIIK